MRSFSSVTAHIVGCEFTGFDLRDSSQHEIGWILGDFCEIVAIDRARRVLTLLVASED